MIDPNIVLRPLTFHPRYPGVADFRYAKSQPELPPPDWDFDVYEAETDERIFTLRLRKGFRMPVPDDWRPAFEVSEVLNYRRRDRRTKGVSAAIFTQATRDLDAAIVSGDPSIDARAMWSRFFDRKIAFRSTSLDRWLIVPPTRRGAPSAVDSWDE